jgi:rubrerythrin
MLNMGTVNRRTTAPKMQMDATLWRCNQCNSFVSIHSPLKVDDACCPACGDTSMEFCGAFASVLGIQFADA